MWLAAIGALLCGVAVLWFVELADDRAGSSKTVLIVLAVAAGVGLVVAVADYLVLHRRRRRR
jgi:hypothetical protein